MEFGLDSMLFWYPKIKNLPIVQPDTEILELTKNEIRDFWEECTPLSVIKKIIPLCRKFGYPCFLRTDLASGKHQWKDSCFVASETDLPKHIFEVVSFTLLADIMGLPFQALIIREFIPMDTGFTAFWGKMPVNPERRYFINNHKVVCHHPYWFLGAIEGSNCPPSVENWQELTNKMNTETENEIKVLTDYALMVAEQFDGYWSVDFCKAKNGEWILIDMATGEKSWHPEDCPDTIQALSPVKDD